MLAAALYALDFAQSQDMAVADFQAGMFSGLKDYDLQSNFEACVVPDQDAFDEIEKLITMIETKNFSEIKTELVSVFGPLYIQDMQSCVKDPEIVEAIKYQKHLEDLAQADPDGEAKAKRAILPHIKKIIKSGEDCAKEWNAGNYYEAGQALGSIDKIVYSPWE